MLWCMWIKNGLLDYKFAPLWILIELFICISILIYLAKRILNRKNGRTSLDGCTALITNGSSELSREIAAILVAEYNCNVILIVANKNGIYDFPQTYFSCISSAINTYYCNLSNHNEVINLAGNLRKRIGGHIDLLIENCDSFEKSQNHPNQSCDDFITLTSDQILSTINLLLQFTFDLKLSKRGQYVSIHNTILKAKQLLNSKSETRQLIQCLSNNHSSDPNWSSKDVHISSVVFNRMNSVQDWILKKRNIDDLAKKIIRGIESNANLVIVNERESLIDYFYKFIKNYKVRI